MRARRLRPLSIAGPGVCVVIVLPAAPSLDGPARSSSSSWVFYCYQPHNNFNLHVPLSIWKHTFTWCRWDKRLLPDWCVLV